MAIAGTNMTGILLNRVIGSDLLWHRITRMKPSSESEGTHLGNPWENIYFEGKQDLQTKVMIALFGLFAEVERDLISERTKEGLAWARAQGRLLGRLKGALGKSKLGGGDPDASGEGCLQDVGCQDRRRVPDRPPSLHPDPKARPESLKRSRSETFRGNLGRTRIPDHSAFDIIRPTRSPPGPPSGFY